MKAELEDPYPGDRICPTRAQFYSVATDSYNYWTTASTDSQKFDIERYLSDLLRLVPPFTFDSKQKLSWLEGEWLLLRCRSEWRTTEASVCDVKARCLTHYARLGLSTPIRYQHEEGPLDPALSLGFGSSPYMPCLVRAWCYILSCRWIETLVTAGQQAQLRQPTQLSSCNFWETVVAGRWHAVLIRGKNTYYAPWSWSKNASNSPQ